MSLKTRKLHKEVDIEILGIKIKVIKEISIGVIGGNCFGSGKLYPKVEQTDDDPPPSKR
jgi:hypothetical protein